MSPRHGGRGVIELWIPGEPKALKRHRMGRGFSYDPSRADKSSLLVKAMQSRPSRPLSAPLRVRVEFVFTRPKHHYGTGRYAGVVKRSAPIHHTTRPDADNCLKLVFDALNGVYWRDDALIASLTATKRYGEAPGIMLTIEELV